MLEKILIGATKSPLFLGVDRYRSAALQHWFRKHHPKVTINKYDSRRMPSDALILLDQSRAYENLATAVNHSAFLILDPARTSNIDLILEAMTVASKQSQDKPLLLLGPWDEDDHNALRQKLGDRVLSSMPQLHYSPLPFNGGAVALLSPEPYVKVFQKVHRVFSAADHYKFASDVRHLCAHPSYTEDRTRQYPIDVAHRDHFAANFALKIVVPRVVHMLADNGYKTSNENVEVLAYHFTLNLISKGWGPFKQYPCAEDYNYDSQALMKLLTGWVKPHWQKIADLSSKVQSPLESKTQGVVVSMGHFAPDKRLPTAVKSLAVVEVVEKIDESIQPSSQG